MQAALAGFEGVEAPTMRDRRGLAEWRVRIRMRDVFDVVEQFFAHDPVREACKTAVGRLPRVQREVINRYFFDEESVPDIADSRDVSPARSTTTRRSRRRRCTPTMCSSRHCTG